MARHPAVAAAKGPPSRVRPRRTPPRPRAAAGFTLVEILVVLAILATLISLVAATIPRAMRAKNVTRTQALVNQIGSTLELLRNDNEQYGKYPPSRSRDLKFGKNFIGKELGMPNDINAGIETIHFLLNNPDIQVSQVTSDEELIGNTDEDSFRSARGIAADALAREYLDAWGRPLVYFHSNDYKDPKNLGDITSAEGEKILVRPKKMSAKAGGQFLYPSSFQLFSLGPNGEQDPDEGEESDDIVYNAK